MLVSKRDPERPPWARFGHRSIASAVITGDGGSWEMPSEQHVCDK